jgi:vacuolar-type H+-ATPase subunit E/Vma4
MALADLIARLEHDAHERVRAIQQNADVEVRAIEQATETAIAEIMSRQFARERDERYLVQQRELTMARRQARGAELQAQHALIGRVLERARTVLPEIGASPAYAGAVPAHLHEALSFLKGLQPRVRCQAAFAAILHAAIDAHDGAQLVIDESVPPGFVAEAADGSVIVDDTLAARFARGESRLTMALARRLADDGR